MIAILKNVLPQALKRPLRSMLNAVLPSRRAGRARRELEQREAEAACRLLTSELFGKQAPVMNTRMELFNYVVSYAADQGVPGLWMEFGVHKGWGLNRIAAACPGTVYGFDSFDGLPEAWVLGKEAIGPKGKFALKAPPKVRENAELVVGWFEDSLPDFVAAHPEPLAFAHVDCDLYSSTKTVLEHVRLQPGSILLFDEYYNYPNWREGEYKAFQEFLAERRVEAACIGYALTGWNAAFRITAIPPA